jgi:hypothetical protein
MPFFVLALAEALGYRAIRVAIVVLMVPQFVIDAVVWLHPRALWPSPEPLNAALERIGWIGRTYEHLLPVAQAGGPIVPALLLVTAVSAGVIALTVLGRSPRKWPDNQR